MGRRGETVVRRGTRAVGIGETGKARDAAHAADRPLSPRSWKGVVPVIPSANVYLRSHWSERMRLQKIFYLELYAAFKDDVPTKATGKRKVKVLVVSTRERDWANLVTPVDKLLLDQMVKLGWLVDDKPAFLDLEVAGRAGTPETVVEISE